MLSIQKSAATPPALRVAQARPGIGYGDLGEVEGLELRTRLCEDQGYLCAYCMSRIDVDAATGDQLLERPDGSLEHPRRLTGCSVEHVVPQSVDDSADLQWRNMIAVCSGRRVWADGLHCDKARGAAAISQLNPLMGHVSSRIAWRGVRARRGPVGSLRPVREVVGRSGAASAIKVHELWMVAANGLADAVHEQVLDDIDTLLINVQWLARHRQQTLDDFEALAEQAARPDGTIPAAWLAQRRRWLTTPNEAGRLPEYAGVLLWRLERWERKAR
jgi:hypothetical protein